MKEIIKIYDKNEIVDYIGKLWRTDSFKASHANGYIQKWVSKISEQPLLFFKMDDDHNEKGHFSAWMGAVALREYENPAINDLYYLHELIHLTTMAYLPDAGFDAWRQKMFQNELATSLESEVLVYFKIPGLRAQSFSHEIWADRFLADKECLNKSAKSLLVWLETERKRVFISPVIGDKVEIEIAQYFAQNVTWAQIWEPSYREVEQHMQGFRVEALFDRKLALFRHEQWLIEKMVAAGRPYPFATEAEAFAKVYWANKKV